MRKQAEKHCFRKRFATMIESFLVFFILLLILFGVMQLYLLSIANMVSEYAAFRGARSSAVGFVDYLVLREAKVKSIPVSGAMIAPERSTDIGNITTQYSREIAHIENYLTGERWLEYEYWGGQPVRHNNYKCKNYGLEIDRGTYCSVCKTSGSETPYLTVSQSPNGDLTSFRLSFTNYPLNMPLLKDLLGVKNINIRKNVELTNHASVY